MELEREQLLKEIMATDFSAFDLHLYLDTHPCDQRALMLYYSYVQKSGYLKNQYERQYGPLNSPRFFNSYRWQWIDSPWPWERQ